MSRDFNSNRENGRDKHQEGADRAVPAASQTPLPVARALPANCVDVGRTRAALNRDSLLVAPVDGVVQQFRIGHGAAVNLGVSTVLFALVAPRKWGVVREPQGGAREVIFHDSV